MCEPCDGAPTFYHDLEPDAQQHFVAELNKSTPVTWNIAATHPAYLYHSATYLYCTGDQALPHLTY